VIRSAGPALPPLLLLAALSSCAGPGNYVNPGGPRFAACYSATPDTNDIRVVTFNIKYAKEIEKSIGLLREEPNLRDADIVLLQEMDSSGTHRIASALRMCYVYYPARFRYDDKRDFGNAILSRWPIEGDRKIILPHNGRFGRTQRIAVAGTVEVRGQPIQVYSIHLATWIEVSFSNRKSQARTIAEDAVKHVGPVIVGGDLNSHDVGEVFVERGYGWPTRDVERTVANGTLDHFFLRGLSLRDSTSVGVVRDNRDASDHKPVWMVVRPPG
jgi:endonuclease/exonuclease/phosphatase family metal-dependent hydrolase